MRILVVDDQPSFRSGLHDLLSTVVGCEVVGEASNGREAVDLDQALRPDVVLMDIRMPVMDGIAATRAIRAARSDACVLVLTTFDEDELVRSAIAAGASGYLLKGTPIDDIVDIISIARRGYIAIGARPVAESTQYERLSDREREIWDLIGEGYTNRQIAERLSLTEGTVKNYVTTILGTLGVRHRTQAALLRRGVR